MLQSFSKLKHVLEFPGCINPCLAGLQNVQVSETDWTIMDTKLCFLCILSDWLQREIEIIQFGQSNHFWFWCADMCHK